MAIATTSQFWTTRLNGENPTSPSVANTQNNEAFSITGSGASASGEYWRVTDARYSITPTEEEYTLFAVLSYNSAPDNDEVLMSLDNGTYKVEVKADGTTEKVKLVGATTVTSAELDIDMTEDNPVPLVLRLTLDSSGNAKLFMREIIEDDDSNTHYLSVTGASGSSKNIGFGNNSGSIDWGAVYVSKHGAFDPDELSPSDFATDTLLRMGMSIVKQLQNSKRMYLKTHMSESAIRYGFDVSKSMLTRLTPPVIHVMLRGINSPEFAALGGGRVDQEYEVIVYVTTRGTNYENAYRLALNIAGECFDEIYTKTGLLGTTDSLINYTCELDHKFDDDDTICTHMLTFTYLRRINMRHR